MHKALFFATLFAFFLTCPVWAADISGVWTISQKNNEGVDDSFDVTIKAAGENLTITGNHQHIGTLSGTGTLKGDVINMNINATGAESKGALSFTYTGKLTGNKMSGTKETKVSGTPGGGQGGPPASGQGAPSMAPGGGAVSNTWTAEKK